MKNTFAEKISGLFASARIHNFSGTRFMPDETPAVANRSFNAAPTSIKKEVDEYWNDFFDLKKKNSYASIFRDNSLRLNLKPGFEDIYIADFVDAIEQNVTNGAYLSSGFFSGLFDFRRQSLADINIDPQLFEKMWDKVFDVFLKYGIPADVKPVPFESELENSILLESIKSGGTVSDLYKLVQSGARVSNNQIELVKVARDGKAEMIVPLLMAGADFKSVNLKRPLVVDILESYSEKFNRAVLLERKKLQGELITILNTLTKLGCEELTSLFATESNPFTLYLKQSILEIVGDVKTGDSSLEFANSIQSSLAFARGFRPEEVRKLPPPVVIHPTALNRKKRTAFKIARDSNIIKELRKRSMKDWPDYVERMKLIGFDINAVCRDGTCSTLLSDCIRSNDKETFFKFIRDPEIDLNAVDQFGNRALDYAISSGDIEYIFALLGDIDSSGKIVPIQGAFSVASPYALDSHGDTLLIKAKKVGGDYLVSILRNKYKLEGPDEPLVFSDYEFPRGGMSEKLPEWEDVFQPHQADVSGDKTNRTPPVSVKVEKIFKEANPNNSTDALTKRLAAIKKAFYEGDNEIVKVAVNSIPLEDMVGSIEWALLAFDGDEKIGTLLINELVRRLETGDPEARLSKVIYIKNSPGYENFMALAEHFSESTRLIEVLNQTEVAPQASNSAAPNDVGDNSVEKAKPKEDADFFGGFGL